MAASVTVLFATRPMAPEVRRRLEAREEIESLIGTRGCDGL